MGELISTLDAYAAEDLHDLSDGLVLDRVAELLQVVNLHPKVHHGFRVERPPDGRWRTYRPDDTEILIGPRI